MEQIEKKLKQLNELQLLYQNHPTPDIRRALKILEDDVLEVYRQERYHETINQLTHYYSVRSTPWKTFW